MALSWSSWATILIVSLAFGLIHLIFDPVTLVNVVLVGIFFSFIVLARGSLWLVAGLHAGWNMVQGQVLGIPVSGIPRDVSLFDYGPTDDASNLLSGGENGLEGSILMTAIMVVACVLAYRYYLNVAATRHPEPAAAATI